MNAYRTQRVKARENFLEYMKTGVVIDNYRPAWFHEVMCDEMNNFAESDKQEYQMLFVPPQNGKSLHSTLGLPTFMLGQNPKLKIAVISYNNTVASLFGDDVSRILKSSDYKALFPDTIVGIQGLKDNSYITETSEGGYIISVGVGGTLTSRTVDVFIFDDLYKGAEDAWSPVFRERVWNYYNTVAGTRGHKKEKMLILYTRWHEDDLAGRLLELQPDKWSSILFQGIKTGEFTHPRDPRKVGEILWPARHSLEKYMELKKLDPVAFEALVQQNPQPSEGMMYPIHNIWTSLKNIKGIRKCYVDTADSGEDFLTAVFYIEAGLYNYVTDIYHTKDNMDVTYKELARRLRANNTLEVLIESNNGGRFFGQQVKELYYKTYGGGCIFKPFTQSNNKEARIMSASAGVQNYILFPHNWKDLHVSAYKAFTRYRREGKNEHDDIPDVLSGIIEHNRTLKRSGGVYGNIIKA
jgi:predicted phage terminase large subunit-like protein